jgi:protein-tyrosine phosphatase
MLLVAALLAASGGVSGREAYLTYKNRKKRKKVIEKAYMGAFEKEFMKRLDELSR